MIQEINGDFLQWLRGFYFVAKKKSFSRAGLDMGRNQPTISHQVRCLEKEFGVTLIDRSGSKLDLTPDGRFFLRKTITIFEEIKDMRGYANRGLSEIEGEIRIASTHAVIRHFLPPYVSDFIGQHPKVTFDIDGSGGRDHILEKVESAEADFGILNQQSVPRHLVYEHLFETKLVLILRKNNPYAIGELPTMQQIAKLPLVIFPRSSTLTSWVERRFSEERLKLNVVLTINNFDTVKKFVELGIGASILDHYTLTQEDTQKLDTFPLEEYFQTRRYGIVLRRRKHLSPCVSVFLKKIKSGILIA